MGKYYTCGDQCKLQEYQGTEQEGLVLRGDLIFLQELKEYEVLLYYTLHYTVNPQLNMSLRSTANSFMRDCCSRRGEELLTAL